MDLNVLFEQDLGKLIGASVIFVGVLSLTIWFVVSRPERRRK